MSYRDTYVTQSEAKSVVFCRDCKWLHSAGGTTGILWKCRVPTGYISTVTGGSEVNTYICEERNRSGDCPDFEPKTSKPSKPWWRLWR